MEDLLIGLFCLFSGTTMSLLGFKVIKPFKEEEKNKEWNIKYGLLFKIGGVFNLVFGFFLLFSPF